MQIGEGARGSLAGVTSADVAGEIFDEVRGERTDARFGIGERFTRALVHGSLRDCGGESPPDVRRAGEAHERAAVRAPLRPLLEERGLIFDVVCDGNSVLLLYRLAHGPVVGSRVGRVFEWREREAKQTAKFIFFSFRRADCQ